MLPLHYLLCAAQLHSLLQAMLNELSLQKQNVTHHRVRSYASVNALSAVPLCFDDTSAQTIGYLYLHAGDTRRAISFLKKAHELAPAAADPGVLVNLGNLLKYAAHASPRSARPLQNSALGDRGENDLDGAMACYMMLAESRPRLPIPYILASIMFDQIGAPAESLRRAPTVHTTPCRATHAAGTASHACEPSGRMPCAWARGCHPLAQKRDACSLPVRSRCGRAGCARGRWVSAARPTRLVTA